MPSREQHLGKADTNGSVLDTIVAGRASPEWAVTIALYRAVHVVEAWAALRQRHHRSHQQRNRTVNQELSAISADYGELYEASRVARYAPDGVLSWSDFDRLSEGLARIEAHVGSRLR